MQTDRRVIAMGTIRVGRRGTGVSLMISGDSNRPTAAVRIHPVVMSAPEAQRPFNCMTSLKFRGGSLHASTRNCPRSAGKLLGWPSVRDREFDGVIVC